MTLPEAAPEYDQRNEAEARRAIEAADRTNLKTGKDAYLVSGERLFLSHATGLTAHAGGGKASALALTKTINHVTVCATAADSLLLPPAKAGMTVWIINRGAAAAQVFGQGTDTINDVATATGVSQAASTTAAYVCPSDGLWYRHLSA